MTGQETPRPTGVLIVDSSALLCRYLGDSRRSLVLDVMALATDVVVTALARTEVLIGLHHIVDDRTKRETLWRAVSGDWDAFWQIPTDDRCLSLASDLGVRYGLGVTNALHLAAIDRLPRPATLLTFDREQVAAASAMGFEVFTASSGAHGGAHGLLADPS